MANNSVILSTLDFDSLKQNLKNYLQTQSVFRDYNFDASNINVLLDVLSYNTHLNAFYLNMIASEMFLDSAQKYDSVVSHAKELNYIPSSYKSSVASINLVLSSEDSGGSILIPKGTVFTGLNSNGSYSFTTNEDKTITSSNSTYLVSNLSIYEGNYLQDIYVMNYDLSNQQFLISNRNVDLDSITVNVIENSGASNTSFTRRDNLYGLDSASNIFFVQPAQNNQYEIVFGDGLFGRKPLNSALINISYRVSSGIDSDGVSTFALSTDLGAINSSTINPTSVTTVSASSGGANQESIESIKFSAPRYFATQQRAVTNDDYASLVLTNFPSQVSDVIVYGGQELDIKQYGRVVLCLKPARGTIVPDFTKTEITNFLQDYIAIPNRIIIDDPEYIYCSVYTRVQYDKKTTSKTASDLSSLVLNSIINYNTNNLDKFGEDFRYSKLVYDIDNSDPSIVSNFTENRMIKRLSPLVNSRQDIEINFNNQIYYDATASVDSNIHSLIHESELELLNEHSSILSDTFTYVDSAEVSHPLSFIEDRDGVVSIFKFTPQGIVQVESIGTVDYITGMVKLNNFKVSSYENYIKVYARPRTKDIFANKNKIIVIDPADVVIEMIEKRT